MSPPLLPECRAIKLGMRARSGGAVVWRGRGPPRAPHAAKAWLVPRRDVPFLPVAKSPGALVREFCKKQLICTHCLHRRALRGVTRCEPCKNRDGVAQRKRLRRKYRREKAAGICVRCHKKPAQATNVRCVECQAYHSAHKKKKRADLKRVLRRESQ